MKNFIHRESLAFRGSTLEGWLFFLGSRFLETYPQMELLRVSGEEIRFDAQQVPAPDGGFAPSDTLYHRRHDDHGVAMLELGRAADGSVELTDLRAGGWAWSSSRSPGRRSRPSPVTTTRRCPSVPTGCCSPTSTSRGATPTRSIAVSPDPARYVDPQQVADLAAVVFHGFVSLSIQHLVHEIGLRMLERYPELTEITFEAQNRTFDPAAQDEADERVKVLTDPRPPYGRIGLTMRRDDASRRE